MPPDWHQRIVARLEDAGLDRGTLAWAVAYERAYRELNPAADARSLDNVHAHVLRAAASAV